MVFTQLNSKDKNSVKSGPAQVIPLIEFDENNYAIRANRVLISERGEALEDFGIWFYSRARVEGRK